MNSAVFSNCDVFISPSPLRPVSILARQGEAGYDSVVTATICVVAPSIAYTKYGTFDRLEYLRCRSQNLRSAADDRGWVGFLSSRPHGIPWPFAFSLVRPGGVTSVAP